MKFNWNSLLTGTLVACALVTTALVIRREFADSAKASTQATAQKAIFIQNWKADLLKGGVSFGSSSASVQFIEFADFECPFCGDFYRKLKSLRERYPTQVSLTYIHFPLPGHRFALPAARVVECAGEQGRFEAMYDQLFGNQDSFGLKPWSEFAAAAGVSDLTQFDACIKKADQIPRIEQGKQLGAKLDVQGTPTIIVNGWKLGRPPTGEELDDIIKAVLAGKSPVKS